MPNLSPAIIAAVERLRDKMQGDDALARGWRQGIDAALELVRALLDAEAKAADETPRPPYQHRSIPVSAEKTPLR